MGPKAVWGGGKWRKNQHRKVIDTEGKCKFLVVLLLLTYWRDDAWRERGRMVPIIIFSVYFFSLLINHTPTSLHKVEVNNSKYIILYIM